MKEQKVLKDLDESLGRLYRQPLDQFIGERNTLAKRLKAEGDVGGADRVKKLLKPSPAAWLINQLYAQERALFDALLEAGAAVRSAQERAGNSASITDASRARSETVQVLKQKALQIARQAGVATNAQLVRQVTATLEALSSTSESTRPELGRLHRDLVPLGFDALTSVAKASVSAPARGSSAGAASARADTSLAEAARLIREMEQQLRHLQRDADLAATKAARALHDAEEAERRAREARELATRSTAEAEEKAVRASQLREELTLARVRLTELSVGAGSATRPR